MTSQATRRRPAAAFLLPNLRLLLCLFATAMTFLLAGCGSGIADPGVAIEALPSEDLAGPCRYNLVQQEPLGTQQGVLVIFERSDTAKLMEDSSVRAMAQSLHYAIVWARECDARSSGDLQADASRGPARTLDAALKQFAVKTGHPEFGSGPIVLFGFSAGGVLSATMANVWPDRLLGVITYAAGSAYTDLDDVVVTARAAAIPTLILANADDDQSGTSRSYRYFERGRAMNAKWGYAVQNNTGHCCSLSTRPILLPWIQAIAATPTGANGAAVGGPEGDAAALPVSFACSPDGVTDAHGDTNCVFTAASLQAGTSVADTGWLPNAAAQTAWLAWVSSYGTN